MERIECPLCRAGTYPHFGYTGTGQCDHCGSTWTYDEGDTLTEESLQRVWAKVPRWIPVTERLPEEDSVVLAFMPEGSELKPEVREMYFVDGEWMNDRGHWPEVTHWMPLPEPPHVKPAAADVISHAEPSGQSHASGQIPGCLVEHDPYRHKPPEVK